MSRLLNILVLLLTSMVFTPSGAGVLYDFDQATTPINQGWLYGQSFTPGVVCGLGADGYQLDTTAGNNIQAGFVRGLGAGDDPILDTVTGYELGFTLRVDSESHASNDRAGFSILAVGDDVSQSIEIGFWEDSVWAYDYTGAFVQGPSALLDTTQMRDYSLRVIAGAFELFVDNSLLLSGALQDYSASGVNVFGIQPYADSNFLFWGDDTSSAQSSVTLASVSFDSLPEPAPVFLLAIGLLGIVWYSTRRYR